MYIKEINIKELQPYENNPRDNVSAVDAVAASIREFGFKVPIVIDGDNVIIAGHTRLKAAQKLGMDKVPCIIANDLSPDQVKAFRLADNKVSEFAEWDYNALAKELSELEMDMQEFGFSLEEISPDDFDEEFSLPDSDNPETRTITLSLCEEQYEICQAVIDYYKDNVEHDFGNTNQKSNALFEGVYQWAMQKNLI